MKKPPLPFDLTETPLLKGRNLVEASAGTGKTYAITAIFLRLILEQDLGVSEILVVTYTEAATEELRNRIRQTLSLALQGFTEGGSEIDFLQTLITRHHDSRGEMIARLESGLRNFDEAAICTIHGFCQRSLKDRAFESGLHFDTELLPDAGPILSEIAEDYWRKKFYRAHPLQVAVGLKNKLGPPDLLRLLHVAKAHHQLRILPHLTLEDRERCAQHLQDKFSNLEQIWNSEKPAIKTLFGDGIRWGNAPYNRSSEMEVWFQDLDHCFSQNDLLFEALHSLKVFCPSSMEEKRSKKGKEALPDHPFFKACEEFCRAEKEFFTALKIDFLEYALPELARRTAERKVQTFDELLVRLDNALRGPAGETLALQLRKKYPATLIDEFQDTDPVQYSIFARIFGEDTFLFLIGDPKQAIYGFRGADIYTYLKAVAEAENRFTLLDNWRSETRLVGGLNALFSLSSNPFVFQNIEFHAVKGRGRADAAPLTINGRHGASLVVLFHSSPENEISKASAQHTLPHVVASEIVTLLDGSATLGGRKLRPEDIAVVVRKNKQARWIQESLRERNVPSVLHTDESVFHSAEAEEIRRVLMAVSQPSNEPIIRAALVTDFLGHNGSEIYEMNQKENLWRQTVEPFHYYRELWIRNGFFRMFRLMLQDRQVRQRLLSFEDGERRLTNVLHLAELLHHASETFSSPRALVDWLGRQQNSEEHHSEDHQLRLERDDNAVRLVTIHKAKGLEYGVVFCPFGWEGTELRKGDPVLFHDETDGTHTLDLGSPDLDRHKQKALTEQLAENIRMLYVSLTRARHRSYLTWGRFNGASTSAPAWLLHTPAPPAENPVSSVQSDLQKLDDAALQQRLEELVQSSFSPGKEPGVLLCNDPASSTAVFTEEGTSNPLFQTRIFTGSIDRSWGIASFSSLTMGQHDESPDYDSPGWNPELEPLASGIFAFPRGTRPGTCLHKIFELLDYQDPEMVRSVVGDQLRAHGYLEDHLCQTVAQTVEKVLSVPLDVSRDDFRLSNISRSERLAEWEFHFPLSKVSAQDVQKILARHHFENQFIDQTQPRLDFDPVQGWMKGFIDLVFCFEGRFYLVDWKSNWLGNQPEDYSGSSLRQEMTQRKYYFQFIIYCLALDQYLRLRLPGYDYQEHFGGVRYIFLRGVDPARPDLGIFRDRPEPDLMDDLRNLLIRKNS